MNFKIKIKEKSPKERYKICRLADIRICYSYYFNQESKNTEARFSEYKSGNIIFRREDTQGTYSFSGVVKLANYISCGYYRII